MMEPHSAGWSDTASVQEKAILAPRLNSREAVGVATAVVDGVVAWPVGLAVLTLQTPGRLGLARFVSPTALASQGRSYPQEGAGQDSTACSRSVRMCRTEAVR